MAAANSNTTPSLQLVFGGERTRDIMLDVETVLERWKAELEGHDHSTTTTPTSSPITLVLRHRSWSIRAMELVAPFIAQIAPRIVALEVDDIIAKQETSKALQVLSLLVQALQEASQLTVINLSDNALGTRSLEILQVLLTKRLTSLKLDNTGVDAECMRVLRESLLGANNHNHDNNNNDDVVVVCALQHLALSRNTIGVEGAKHVGAILPHCPDLTTFIYAGARPQEVGSTYIVNGFREQLELKRQRRQNGDDTTVFLALQELNLSECTLGDTIDRPISTLCQLIPAMPHLKKLYLGDCGLEMDGLRMLIDVLTTARPPLEELSLNEVGEIRGRGGRLLASCLSNFSYTLRILSLEGNYLGWRGVRALVPFFNADESQIRTVRLNCNELGPRAGEQLLSIRNNVPWQQLTLEDNFFDDEELQESIKRHFARVDVAFGGSDDQEAEDEDEDDDDDDDDDDDNKDVDDDKDVEEDNDEVVEGELARQIAQLNIEK